MPKIKAIVLDFDNCIALDENTHTGSEEIKDEAWFEVFPEYGRKTLDAVLQEAKNKVTGGKGDRKDIAHQVLFHFDYPKGKISDEILRRCDKFNEITQKKIKQIKISEKARKALGNLFKKFPLYLNTATPFENAMESLRALEIDKFFKKIYGRPGTKKENLFKIIDNESVRPSEMLFVDDQQKSWEISEEIGCRFIGMYTLRNKLWHNNQQPFVIVNSLSELPDIISKI